MITILTQLLGLATLSINSAARNLAKMMSSNRYFSLLLAVTAVSLTSCSTPSAQTNQSNSLAVIAAPPAAAKSSAQPDPTKPQPTKPQPTKPQPAKPQPTKPQPAKPQPAKTVTVNAYKVDSRCTKQVAEQVTVPAQQPIQGAIAEVIEQGSNSDFKLAGFRVNVKSGLATVDLRVPPGAKRQLQSLSTCEQMALLGSIRKTLTSNAQWKIKTVNFTDRGRALVL
jgi:hypothetical protein